MLRTPTPLNGALGATKMEDQKSLLRSIGRLDLIEPTQLAGMDDYVEWLDALLQSRSTIYEDNSGHLELVETRQLIDRINGLRIGIQHTRKDNRAVGRNRASCGEVCVEFERHQQERSRCTDVAREALAR